MSTIVRLTVAPAPDAVYDEPPPVIVITTVSPPFSTMLSASVGTNTSTYKLPTTIIREVPMNV